MLSGISLPQILLIVLLVVLLFGTSKLKNLGKDLGGAIKGFKESMREPDDTPTPPASPAPLQQKTLEGPQATSTTTPTAAQNNPVTPPRSE